MLRRGAQVVFLLCLLGCGADKEFWWMDQNGSFGQQGQQAGWQQQGQAGAVPSYQGSQDLLGVASDPLPMTECPVGSVCREEASCASQWSGQQDKETAFIPCMNPATQQLGVCCPQRQGAVVALPITQGLSGAQGQGQAQLQGQGQGQRQGSCPSSPPGLLPLEQCQGRQSNCWSVGQPDVDCRNNALCCFDGCANSCQGSGGSVSPARPALPARPAVVQPPRQPQQAIQPQQQRPKPQPKPQPRPQAQLRPVQPARDPWPQNQPARAPPAKAASQPRPTRPAAGRPAPARRPVAPASSEPFVTCPSAMKCVPRGNCDLKGVMTNQVQSYSAQQQLQSVPLIPCVNQARGNQVDVCCRDPNYQDPWPGGMMMGAGVQGAGAGQGLKAGGSKQGKQPNKNLNKKRPNVGKKNKNTGKASAGGHTGACSSGADCPPNTPVCSEYGYCQCATYTPGSPDCWMQGGNW